MKAYILQRDDGKFYWHGKISSQYGWTNNLDEASLFKTLQGAKSRTNIEKTSKVKKVEVSIKIIEEIQ